MNSRKCESTKCKSLGMFSRLRIDLISVFEELGWQIFSKFKINFLVGKLYIITTQINQMNPLGYSDLLRVKQCDNCFNL